ncbi:unique cartilage matrix-associated protein [Lampris incognitus]|uniref:unique cartilage matrix-associated protein n=1 Tax=Lampris incognitus TaxID=2546036 RepID=UPI0024B52B3A|nr:unique cartilage matrix-associated protein [Lampris incognitus]
MSRTHAAFLALVSVLLALSLSREADTAAVPDGKERGTKATDPQGPLRRIFMQERDASSFFRRRSRRGVKSQDEIDAEQKQVVAADERKREYHEEKRNAFESYAEEENDEQDERSRESTEQWREFHYDGMHPPHEYNRQSI